MADPLTARDLLCSLTPAQLAAVEALAAGMTHAEAAESAGVARETVTRWSGHHPAFRAALVAVQAAAVADTLAGVSRVRAKALAVVERHLDDLDRCSLSEALDVLRLVGTDTGPQPHVPTPDDLIAAHVPGLFDRLAEMDNPPPTDADLDAAAVRILDRLNTAPLETANGHRRT